MARPNLIERFAARVREVDDDHILSLGSNAAQLAPDLVESDSRSALVVVSNGQGFVFIRTNQQPGLFLYKTSFSAASWLTGDSRFLCDPNDFLLGYLESATKENLAGWAINLLSRDVPQIGLWISNHLRTTSIPTFFRSDIALLGSEAREHAFLLPIPNYPFDVVRGVDVRFLDFDVALSWIRIHNDDAIWTERIQSTSKQRSQSSLSFEIDSAQEDPNFFPRPAERIALIFPDETKCQVMFDLPIGECHPLCKAGLLEIRLPACLSRQMQYYLMSAIDRLTVMRGKLLETRVLISNVCPDKEILEVECGGMAWTFPESSKFCDFIDDLNWPLINLLNTREPEIARQKPQLSSIPVELMSLSRAIAATDLVLATTSDLFNTPVHLSISRLAASLCRRVVVVQLGRREYKLFVGSTTVRSLKCSEEPNFVDCIRALINELLSGVKDIFSNPEHLGCERQLALVILEGDSESVLDADFFVSLGSDVAQTLEYFQSRNLRHAAKALRFVTDSSQTNGRFEPWPEGELLGVLEDDKIRSIS